MRNPCHRQSHVYFYWISIWPMAFPFFFTGGTKNPLPSKYSGTPKKSFQTHPSDPVSSCLLPVVISKLHLIIKKQVCVGSKSSVLLRCTRNGKLYGQRRPDAMLCSGNLKGVARGQEVRSGRSGSGKRNPGDFPLHPLRQQRRLSTCV